MSCTTKATFVSVTFIKRYIWPYLIFTYVFGNLMCVLFYKPFIHTLFKELWVILFPPRCTDLAAKKLKSCQTVLRFLQGVSSASL